MKLQITLGVLMLVSVATYAQNRPPQNVRRNIVTSKYEVVDGARTQKYRAVHQEIIDSLGRKHTILEWDFNTGQIYDYVWHVFTGKQITRTFTFRNQLLKLQQDFSYTADSLLNTETIYLVNPGDTAFYAKLTYTYSGRNPIQIEAKNLKGKRLWRTKSVYDANGTEITRNVKAKSGYHPLDSIISLVCTPTYDSLGRLIEKVTTTKYLTGKQTATHFKYAYNEHGLLQDVTEFDKSGAILYRINNKYNEKGILKFISRFNANNVLIDYQAIRYELYPTRDRRRSIIEH